MLTADHYRRLADEAERHAHEMVRVDHRDEMLEIARQWRRFASILGPVDDGRPHHLGEPSPPPH